jgi:hypothetical protein
MEIWVGWVGKDKKCDLGRDGRDGWEGRVWMDESPNKKYRISVKSSTILLSVDMGVNVLNTREVRTCCPNFLRTRYILYLGASNTQEART